MTLICLLTLDFSLDDFIGMSGWLPFQQEIEELARDDERSKDQDPIAKVSEYLRDSLEQEILNNTAKANSSAATPVFLGHGESDDKIKPYFGKPAYEILITCGYNGR